MYKMNNVNAYAQLAFLWGQFCSWAWCKYVLFIAQLGVIHKAYYKGVNEMKWVPLQENQGANDFVILNVNGNKSTREHAV